MWEISKTIEKFRGSTNGSRYKNQYRGLNFRLHKIVFVVRNRKYFLGFLCVLLVGCINSAPPNLSIRTERPVVLFWCDYPHILKNMNYYTTHVWVQQPDSGNYTGPEWSQDYFLSRSITPLKWVGGRIFAREKDVEELVKIWCTPAMNGFVGIGIDEFGMLTPRLSAKLGKALEQAKATCPELIIATWHSGPLTKKQANYYVEGADLVMLEAYFSGRSFYRWLLPRNIRVARNAGIIYKTVVALGINDQDSRATGRGFWNWANTPEELERQMLWIRRLAPDMPGIAFFAPRASKPMLIKADRLAAEIFTTRKTENQ